MNAIKLSFIIPALNEEQFIERTINSIKTYCSGFKSVEIIVADHGSSDRTREIATMAGAWVTQPGGKTISELRNLAASQSTGDILVFLDADVTLTAEWSLKIDDAIGTLSENYRAITGAVCQPPSSNENFLSRYWFMPRSRSNSSSHIGSGHLIITHRFFDELGGFTDDLVTGEDYDICMRAILLGGTLHPNLGLVAIHHGVPKSLFAFVRREWWHGLGDRKTFATFISSKVAVAATLFLLLHLLAIIAAFNSLLWLLVPAIALVILLVISAIRVVRPSSIRELVGSIVVFYLYYFGRAMSLIMPAPRRQARK